jgi:hypothetical protein
VLVVGLEAGVQSLQVLEGSYSARVVCCKRRAAQALAQDLVSEALAGWVEDGAEDAALDLWVDERWVQTGQTR